MISDSYWQLRSETPRLRKVHCVAGVAALFVSQALCAQAGSRNVEVVAEGASASPEALPSIAPASRYELERRQPDSIAWERVNVTDRATYPRVGDFVRLCVTPARSGFATLWVTDSTGTDYLLWPNSIEPADINGQNLDGEKVTARRVEAGGRVCPGDTGSKPSIRANVAKDNPTGELELYYHWSPTIDTQLGVPTEAGKRGVPQGRPRTRQVIVVGEEVTTSTEDSGSINLNFQVLGGD